MLFWERLWENLPYFLEVLIPAAGMTVRIAAGAFVLAIVVGLLLALLQTVKISVITAVVRTYIEIIRGTPVLAQLFILYFGLTEVGIRFTPVQAAILGLGCNGGAYLAEVFRAGIQSIHAGQMEAALTVGMTPMSAMRYVIFPRHSMWLCRRRRTTALPCSRTPQSSPRLRHRRSCSGLVT